MKNVKALHLSALSPKPIRIGNKTYRNTAILTEDPAYSCPYCQEREDNGEDVDPTLTQTVDPMPIEQRGSDTLIYEDQCTTCGRIFYTEFTLTRVEVWTPEEEQQ